MFTFIFFCCRAEESKEIGEWLTAKQIMANNGYHDEKVMDYETVKSALLAGLLERDHDKPDMAKLGIKQYETFRVRGEKSSGSKREDTLQQGGEVDEKLGDKLAKVFHNTDFTVPHAGNVEVAILLEAWKKESMDLEKKIGAMTARSSKAIQTGQSLVLKLIRHVQMHNTNLAGAQKSNLEEKLEVATQALKDFTVSMSAFDSKTETNAKRQATAAEEAVPKLREHLLNFEKVISLSRNYLNMFD